VQADTVTSQLNIEQPTRASKVGNADALMITIAPAHNSAALSAHDASSRDTSTRSAAHVDDAHLATAPISIARNNNNADPEANDPLAYLKAQTWWLSPDWVAVINPESGELIYNPNTSDDLGTQYSQAINDYINWGTDRYNHQRRGQRP
jgi:hypothetical protein